MTEPSSRCRRTAEATGLLRPETVTSKSGGPNPLRAASCAGMICTSIVRSTTPVRNAPCTAVVGTAAPTIAAAATSVEILSSLALRTDQAESCLITGQGYHCRGGHAAMPVNSMFSPALSFT